jgi:hypothetical protein
MPISEIQTSDPVSAYRETINELVSVANEATIFRSGTLGARPAPNAVPAGTHYFATDLKDLSFSDGTQWRTLTPTARCLVWGFGSGQSVATATHTALDFSPQVNLGGVVGSGVVTLPVTGAYEVSVKLRGGDMDTHFEARLSENGSPLSFQASLANEYVVSHPPDDKRTVEGTRIATWNAGTTLAPAAYHTAGANRTITSSFSVKLLAQTA